MNPVLQRELIERWRSSRATTTLTAYLALLSLVLYLLYRTGTSMLAAQLGPFGDGGVMAGPVLGRFLLESLLLLVLVLVLFVAPGYAAAQLSGERERRTLPLLQATLLRPRQIVLGKLGAAIAWIMVLIVAAMPIGATAFFLGGVTVGELLRGVGFIAALGLCVAAIALGISAVTRRTTTSIVLTYATVLALTGGTLFVSGVELVARRTTGGAMTTPAALHLNPFVGLADAVVDPDLQRAGMGGLPLPLTAIASVLPDRRDAFFGGGMGPRMVDDVFIEIEEPMRMVPPPPPPPDLMPAPPPPAPPPDMPDGAALEPMPALPDPAEPYFDAPPAMEFGPGVVGPGPPPQPQRGSGRGLWRWVLGLHAGLGLTGLVVATRRLRTGRAGARRRGARREARRAAAEAST